MKDLEEVYYYLAIKIERKRSKKFMLLHQINYLTSLLKKFGMENCKPISTPRDQLPYEGDAIEKNKYRALFGSLTYAVTGTRPILAQWFANPIQTKDLNTKKL